MKTDSAKLDFSIVAGILLVLIASVFLGFALVGCSLINSDNVKPSINLDFKMFQAKIVGIDPYLSGSNPIVSVAQKGDCVMDTEQGSIEIVEINWPVILPLYIDQDFLDNFWTTVAVTGGYEPISGSIDLYQDEVWKGQIEIMWMYIAHEPGYTDYWTANFVLPKGVDSIELDSNQWPDEAIPLYPEYDNIPGQSVLLDWEGLWQGGHEETQCFELIQVHDMIISKKSPQLSMRLL
ncbi:MAG: hypothetical protein ACFFA7_17950 [Promethearchaeota archaeon]